MYKKSLKSILLHINVWLRHKARSRRTWVWEGIVERVGYNIMVTHTSTIRNIVCSLIYYLKYVCNTLKILRELQNVGTGYLLFVVKQVVFFYLQLIIILN